MNEIRLSLGGDKLSNIPDFLNDFFNAYKETGEFNDAGKLEIAARKREFEETLDEMWRIYRRGLISQIVEYNKQVSEIKKYGYKVLRNSVGVHKIVLIKR